VDREASVTSTARLPSVFRILIFIVCLAVVPLSHAQFADDAQSSLLQRIVSLKTSRSVSRPLAVVGTNVEETLAVLNWAEEAAGRFERVTGLPVSSPAHFEIRISLRPASTGAVPAGVIGRTGAWVEPGPKRFVQGMAILGVQRVDPEDADAELCASLLTCLAATRPLASGAPRVVPAVPSWLSVGLSQNLHANRKARNGEALGERLLEGRLPSIPSLLGAEGAPDRAASGGLAAWILSFPGRAERLGAILDRVAAGGGVTPEWFATSLISCESVSELDEEWDAWVLRQKRMVYEPGVAGPEFLRRLRWDLAVYPGDPGVPLSTNLSERISFRRLLERRDESWVPLAARSKAVSLRLLAAGRGREAVRVAEGYAFFLDGLGKKMRSADLDALLKAAERDFARLANPAVGETFPPGGP
jgi:hypothetical protein